MPASHGSPIPWEGPRGGDARLHAVVPLLSSNGRDANASAWPLVSTHVPGRSGRECRDRWDIIRNLDDGFSRLIERQSELKDDEQYKLVKMYTEYGKVLDAAIKWLKVRRRGVPPSPFVCCWN